MASTLTSRNSRNSSSNIWGAGSDALRSTECMNEWIALNSVMLTQAEFIRKIIGSKQLDLLPE